jgi:hypothetical protein
VSYNVKTNINLNFFQSTYIKLMLLFNEEKLHIPLITFYYLYFNGINLIFRLTNSHGHHSNAFIAVSDVTPPKARAKYQKETTLEVLNRYPTCYNFE